MEPMEVELPHPRPCSTTPRHRTTIAATSLNHPLDRLWSLLKIAMQHYPKLTAAAAFLFLGCVVFNLSALFSAGGKSNKSARATSSSSAYTTRKSDSVLPQREYSDLDLDYSMKAMQMDHWCLFGGDNDCSCTDFTEPFGREERNGWLPAHEWNIAQARAGKTGFRRTRKTAVPIHDVVFLGDDTTELWNGKWLNTAVQKPSGKEINAFWNATFTKRGGGQLDGLALGIAGDRASNLLYRVLNGELPDSLLSRVWWILIGTNDLALDGCSEEAVALSILRVAEEVRFRRPGDTVVLQGLLPRSSRTDGLLVEVQDNRPRLNTTPPSRARITHDLWPFILRVNQQLRKWCKENDNAIYFDATKLFVGKPSAKGDSYLNEPDLRIVKELMPDHVHPSAKGMRLMGEAIAADLLTRILDPHREESSSK